MEKIILTNITMDELINNDNADNKLIDACVEHLDDSADNYVDISPLAEICRDLKHGAILGFPPYLVATARNGEYEFYVNN